MYTVSKSSIHVQHCATFDRVKILQQTPETLYNSDLQTLCQYCYLNSWRLRLLEKCNCFWHCCSPLNSVKFKSSPKFYQNCRSLIHNQNLHSMISPYVLTTLIYVILILLAGCASESAIMTTLHAFIIIIVIIHCESKKTCHYTFVCNFAKCWPIFKIFTLTDSVVNLQ